MRYTSILLPAISLCFLSIFAACGNAVSNNKTIPHNQTQQSPVKIDLPEAGAYGAKVAQAAESIIDPSIKYIPDYIVLDYPGGDVPAHTGVCTDVVIRSLRKLNVDLQKEVHEDMKRNFAAYPKTWGLSSADKNIDHRRVPNLMKYFERKGYSQSITQSGKDYLPGDIVTWVLSNGMTHIGIVSANANRAGTNYQIVHNIGSGQVEEDVLFAYDITGHYRLK